MNLAQRAPVDVDRPEAGEFRTLDGAGLAELLDQAGSVLDEPRSMLSVAFSFNWRGMAVDCRIAGDQAQPRLELATDITPLPYSAENAAKRRYLQHLNDPALKLPIGSYEISASRRFRHRVGITLPTPVTGGVVVSAVVRLLLSSRGLIDLARQPI
ncbi:MAG: hypothetical protein QF578_11585 [Alphaproteobacteria bacterium]|jgi:hypothetical protein|nr:hypothetical protein [Alphaproteobacteria bacterium]MDP6565459.1 hypothetical protein [Alphaproteobacteria bacterium]MDP6815407.1 hypothetical protein [Alphaproteobacteria bacterium]